MHGDPVSVTVRSGDATDLRILGKPLPLISESISTFCSCLFTLGNYMSTAVTILRGFIRCNASLSSEGSKLVPSVLLVGAASLSPGVSKLVFIFLIN